MLTQCVDFLRSRGFRFFWLHVDEVDPQRLLDLAPHLQGITGAPLPVRDGGRRHAQYRSQLDLTQAQLMPAPCDPRADDVRVFLSHALSIAIKR